MKKIVAFWQINILFLCCWEWKFDCLCRAKLQLSDLSCLLELCMLSGEMQG